MPNEIKQKIAGKAVIIHNGKVLILRESKKYDEGTNEGKYDFPGGRVEPGESLKDALKREVKEECGLEIKIGEPIFVGEWNPIVNNVTLQIFGIFFMCATSNSEVILGEDHNKYEWIDPKNFDKYNLVSPIKQVLRKIT